MHCEGSCDLTHLIILSHYPKGKGNEFLIRRLQVRIRYVLFQIHTAIFSSYFQGMEKGVGFESHCVLGDVWCNGSITEKYLVKIPTLQRGRGVVPCQFHRLETQVRILPTAITVKLKRVRSNRPTWYERKVRLVCDKL